MSARVFDTFEIKVFVFIVINKVMNIMNNFVRKISVLPAVRFLIFMQVSAGNI